MLSTIEEGSVGYNACHEDFQAHIVVMLTQLPLQALLRKSDYTGKIAKWGTMLGAFDMKCIPCTTIKWQVLADFVAEFTKNITNNEETKIGAFVASVSATVVWEVYTDRAIN